MHITSIGSLLGTKGNKNILGIIYEVQKGVYCMEDEAARVTISLLKDI